MNYVVLTLSSVVSLGLFMGCSPKTVKPKEKISLEKEIIIEETKVLEVSPIVTLEPVVKVQVKPNDDIYSLDGIPQNISYFTKNIENKSVLYDVQKKYEQEYFSVWNIGTQKDKLQESKWPFSVYKMKNSFGANLQPLKQKFFDDMYESANFEKFSTLNIKALTLRETNLRAFPTIQPLFKNPVDAGEGYPFDYLQSSTIHANKPIFVSHYSKDKDWAFVFTSFTSGWIKTNEFVSIDNKHTNIWQKAQQVHIVKEDEPIYDMNGNFLFKSKIGMMFALIKEDESSYIILSVSSYKNNKPLFLKSKISKDVASKETLLFTKENIEKITKEVSKTNYGWGGLGEQRDCSSMLRDFYAPFGIWLPRNSSRQALVGKTIDLENLSYDEKIASIKKNAIPFETLLHKKGHIMMYAGEYNNKIIIFHNVWGIKTKKDGIEGRIVLGKPIFSTLGLGENQENYDEEEGILNNIKGINTITK